VQMNWQTGNMSTNWIRVMTPDGGSSDEVRTNRGFVFIPEVGDYVLVGFRHGDPNRPYVMGSLFNGTTGAGGFAENHKKSLTTRSGSTITFDDAAHTILLQTTHANKIFVDERNGTIAISSAEEVNVNTKNVNINASEDMKINVGKNLELNVGEDSNVSIGGSKTVSIGENVTTSIEGDLRMDTAGSMEQTTAEMSMIVTQGDAIISAASKALLQGGEDARISKG
jgi:phage-related baseplate assembly protein